MAFDKKTWANNQAGGTPLDASGLNDLEDRIESGIDEKADKSWAMKNLPLVNGWTGTLVYDIHDTGLVHLRGEITAGVIANNTVIAEYILQNYRPEYQCNVPVVIDADPSKAGLRLTTSGRLQIRGPLASELTEGVTIRINYIYRC
jgi:hypothetical protein